MSKEFEKPWIVPYLHRVRCLVCRPFHLEDRAKELKFDTYMEMDGTFLLTMRSLVNFRAMNLMRFILDHRHGRTMDPVAVFCDVTRKRKCEDFISPTEILRNILADELLKAAGVKRE